ncbi:hypothetical protein [Escherichia phage BF17]|nr:hypothetical protein [Escherichia phage BF17]
MLPFARMVKFGNVAPEPKPIFKNRLQCSADSKFYLHTTGDLYWYGTATYGQSGNGAYGSTNTSTSWTNVNTNVERYWGGVQGTIAIKKNGTIWYTGSRSVIPILSADTNGVWVEVTQNFADFGVIADDIDNIVISGCLRVFLKNGKWFYCGAGIGGVFGNGSTASVTQFTYSTIENVRSAGCAIRSTGLVLNDGTYWYAGNTFVSGTSAQNVLTFTQESSIITATKAVNTIETSYIFLNDGTVKVASTNVRGQAGTGNTTPVPMSALIPNLSFQGEIELVGELGTNLAGPSCTIKNNNKLFLCGLNTNGQCGVGSNVANITTFTEMNLSALEGRAIGSFCRGYSYTMLVDEADNLYTCGVPNLTGVSTTNVPTRVPDSLLPWK